jgi:hypothetical protein
MRLNNFKSIATLAHIYVEGWFNYTQLLYKR